jgi:hypothetical protein
LKPVRESSPCHPRLTPHDDAGGGGTGACWLEEPERTHIFAVLKAIDGIHEGTLRPPAADDSDRQWAHEQAIAIFRDALRMMPEFTDAFEDWHRAYTAPPPKPLDPKLARLELDRMEHNLAIRETLSRTATGRAHLKETGDAWTQGPR